MASMTYQHRPPPPVPPVPPPDRTPSPDGRFYWSTVWGEWMPTRATRQEWQAAHSLTAPLSRGAKIVVFACLLVPLVLLALLGFLAGSR